MVIYAVIKSGGKQYRVSPGDIVRVERLSVGPGNRIEISDVCLFVNGGAKSVGKPTVANVRVIAEVVEEGCGEKIRVFKTRHRKHYLTTIGHAGEYSAIRIDEIIQGERCYRVGGIAHMPDDGKKEEPPAAPPTPHAPTDAATGQAATAMGMPKVSSTLAEEPPTRQSASQKAMRGSEGASFGIQAPLSSQVGATASERATLPSGRLYWPFALLALLLVLIGWMWKGSNEHPAGAPDNQTAPAEQVKPPAIKDVKVRKPAAASSTTAPAQPPD